MASIKYVLNESRGQEVNILLEKSINDLKDEGFSVEFGTIGLRTTYAFIHNEDHSVEIVGYTFLKDMKYYKENTGRLKALQQAMARKKIAEEAENK